MSSQLIARVVLHRQGKSGMLFWEAWVYANEVEIRWGQVGKVGSCKFNPTAGPDESLAFAKSNRNRKMSEGKGYFVIEDTLETPDFAEESNKSTVRDPNLKIQPQSSGPSPYQQMLDSIGLGDEW